MQDIKVDPYGIKIMLPKGSSFLIKLRSLSCIEANILKQEMLSLGADVALARDTLTGKAKRTDCLLIGNLSQYNRLKEKLKKQPFGLNNLSIELACALDNYQINKFVFEAGNFKFNINRNRAYIMGIVNLTPDSFSGDGIYKKYDLGAAYDYVERLICDGADIVDIGGESSRPGAEPVSKEEELKRIIPLIKKLGKKIKVPISIDTYKPVVAKAALDNGAVIINDISGLQDNGMIKVAAQYKSGVVIMHSKGTPKTMQRNPRYESLFDEMISYFNNSISRADCLGVNKKRIIIDPGIGFGKALRHNLEIIKNLKELKILGYPLLIGPSRKSFIGKILNAGIDERLAGTIAACVLSFKNGANFLRVHDVKQVKQALKLAAAV